MALTTTRVYADGEVLLEAELDQPIDEIETFFNVTKIDDSYIQNNAIDGGSKLLNGSVTPALMPSSLITTEKLNDASITGVKLASDVIGAGLVQDVDNAIDINVDNSSIEIAFNALRVKAAGATTAKFATGAVTRAKLSEDNTEFGVISASRGLSPTGLYAAVLNTWYYDTADPYPSAEIITTTITTGGRPVLITVMGIGHILGAGPVWVFPVYVSQPAAGTTTHHLQVTRDGTSVGGYKFIDNPGPVSTAILSYRPDCFVFLDTPGAGTYEYRVEQKISATTGASNLGMELEDYRIVAVEL
jgi:hypothetical protein